MFDLKQRCRTISVLTSKYCESDSKASGASALCSSHCTLMSHTHRSAALQVEHISYSVGKGAVLGGLIASSSSDLAEAVSNEVKLLRYCT